MLNVKLQEKRDELVWALNAQGYNGQEIKDIFSSISHRSTATRILRRMPKGYRPKWVKRDEV